MSSLHPRRVAAFTAALVLLSLLPAATTSAGTRASADWGWVTVRDATGDTFPSGKDGASSSGSDIAVVHLGTGHYQVTFYGVQADGTDVPSAVLLTPMGSSGRTCAMGSWVKNGGNEEIEVRCQTLAGAPLDTGFTLSWLEADGIGGHLDYAWNLHPAVTCSTGVGYVSGGGAIQTCPAGTIARTVFTGDGVRGGTALVTAQDVIDGVVSDKPNGCTIGTYAGVGTTAPLDEKVEVACWGVSGEHLIGQRHEIVFLKGLGLKGVVRKNVAYLTSRRPTAASYTPAARDRYSSSGGAITVARLGRGRYVVTLLKMPLGGAAQVSPLISSERRVCTIAGIEKRKLPQRVKVDCFDQDGHLADTRFTFAFER